MANLGELIYSLGIDTSQLRRSEQEIIRSTRSVDNSMSALLGKAKGIAGAIATVYATLKVGQYVNEATQLAARYETLGTVMEQVGKNAFYSKEQLHEYAKGLQENGISMMESRAQITRMIQAEIDLKDARELGRIAQDAAVIGNTDSSEAFARMIWGIKSGQTEILRNLGLNVSWERSYKELADQLGKNVTSLTEYEKMTARVTAAKKEGLKIEGTYAAAMGTAGKLMSSTVRLVENAKIMFGQLFLPSYTKGVDIYYESLKKLNKTLEDLVKSGQLLAWAKNIQAGFEDLVKTAKDLWDILMSFPEGVIDYFKRLAKASDDAKKNIEGINAIKAETTNWDKWVIFFTGFGETIIATFKILWRWAGATAAYTLHVFSIALMAIVKAYQSAVEIIESLQNFDLKGAKKAFGDLFINNAKDAWKEIGRAGDIVLESWGVTWKEEIKDLADRFGGMATSHAGTSTKRYVDPKVLADLAKLKGELGEVARASAALATAQDQAWMATKKKAEDFRDSLQDTVAGFSDSDKLLVTYYNNLENIAEMFQSTGENGAGLKAEIVALNEALLKLQFGEIKESMQDYIDSLGNIAKYLPQYKSVIDAHKKMEESIDGIIEANKKLGKLDEVSFLEKMKKDMEDLKKLRIAEDFDDLAESIQNYIDVGKDVAGISTGFKAINKEIDDQLEILDGMIAGLKEIEPSLKTIEMINVFEKMKGDMEAVRDVKLDEYLKDVRDVFDEISFASMEKYEQAVARTTKQYADQQKSLQDLRAAGMITPAEYVNTSNELKARMGEDLSVVKANLTDLGQFTLQAYQNMEGYASNAFFDVMMGNYDNLLDSFVSMLVRMVAEWQAAQLMMKMFGGGAGDLGKGGSNIGGWVGAAAGWLGSAFGGGASIAMAGGGTITEPVFGIGKSGRSYLFGESGWEDVVPRNGSGGNSSRGSAAKVTQNIYVTGTVNSRTANQIAKEAAQKQNIIQARLG